MHEVVFGVPGRETVRACLYQRDGVLGYNYARGDFTARDGGQSSPLVRDVLDGKFHFPVAWLGPARLPAGDYRLRVDGGIDVYFSLAWNSLTGPAVTVHGQRFPQDAAPPFSGVIGPENVGGINRQAVADTLQVILGAVAQSGTGKPAPRPPRPQPSGPTLEFAGKTRSVAEWAAEKGLNPLTVYARLAAGCTVEQALDAPSRGARPLDHDGRPGRAIELD